LDAHAGAECELASRTLNGAMKHVRRCWTGPITGYLAVGTHHDPSRSFVRVERAGSASGRLRSRNCTEPSPSICNSFKGTIPKGIDPQNARFRYPIPCAFRENPRATQLLPSRYQHQSLGDERHRLQSSFRDLRGPRPHCKRYSSREPRRGLCKFL